MSVLTLEVPPATTPNQWAMQIGGGAAMGGAPGSGAAPGCSNGLVIAAGTNAADSPIWVMNDAGTQTYFRINGDGSGEQPADEAGAAGRS